MGDSTKGHGCEEGPSSSCSSLDMEGGHSHKHDHVSTALESMRREVEKSTVERGEGEAESMPTTTSSTVAMRQRHVSGSSVHYTDAEPTLPLRPTSSHSISGSSSRQLLHLKSHSSIVVGLHGHSHGLATSQPPHPHGHAHAHPHTHFVCSGGHEHEDEISSSGGGGGGGGGLDDSRDVMLPLNAGVTGVLPITSHCLAASSSASALLNSNTLVESAAASGGGGKSLDTLPPCAVEVPCPSPMQCAQPCPSDPHSHLPCMNTNPEEAGRGGSSPQKTTRTESVRRAWVFFIALSFHSVFDGLSLGSETNPAGFYSTLIAVVRTL